MEKYNPKEIEAKWQEYWKNQPELFEADENSSKEKKYILDMFPYPSGDGLHVGHVESYTATDIMSRYYCLQGKNVLHPQGWDAFGLPAENYAIKTKIHPSETTKKAIATFKKQMGKLGFSYDWSREVNSSDPEYYKWTQWFFLQLYKNKLAYKAKAKVNWCPSCQTVLANEQVADGTCERCDSKVIQKDLEQWFFKITDFIEDSEKTQGLLSGLDKVDWPESTKQAQRNWIGRSEGTTIKFEIKVSNLMKNPNFQIPISKQIPNPNDKNTKQYLEVFTTRVDTIFGCTYCVMAPEHKIISNFKSQISNLKEIDEYILESKKKSDLMRMEAKVKTGVEIKGIKVINPFNNEELPLFVADYVLAQYGTGAVMAVPAHDERDWEFAKKYNLSIKQSITPDNKGYEKTIETLDVLEEIFNAAEKNNLKIWLLGGLAIPFYSRVIYREHNDIDLIAKDDDGLKKAVQLFEDLGFEKKGEKKISENLTNYIFKKGDTEIDIGPNKGEFGLANDFEEEVKSLMNFNSRVLSLRFIKSFKEYQLKNRNKEKDKLDFEYLNGKVFVDDGILVDSGKYSSLTSEKARGEMTKWLEKNNLGSRKINYKLRDWLVSRQRYWGAPIPIIYCEKCGEMPVPEKDLPVMLPTDIDFNPTGESPLKKSKSFHNVQCPKCGEKARRESDTMDTFVCSSWYYFRYADPKNEKAFADKDQIKKWLPVDLYVGGAEHTVLHLLYARFFTKVLHKLGHIDFAEPFLKLRHQGIILAEDGNKMSKSKGNVVNPDEVVEKFGADSLRMFEMFMGPLEDMKPWNTKGIVGLERFLEKVYKLKSKISNPNDKSNPKSQIQNLKIDNLLHKTIKKVTEDIENFRFNTAISQMMILANEMDKQEKLLVTDYRLLITLLSPFAPHIAEEIWEKLGNKKSIFLESWPKYDEKLIQDEEIELIIQINGKVRDKIKASADISEEEAKKLALESEKVMAHIKGKEIKKIIFVQGKLISIVL
jgi:leucyl-tRNA synthetase